MSSAGDRHNERIAIAFTVDNNYAMPVAVTIKSLMVNIEKGRDVAIFVVDGGVTTKQKRKVESAAASEYCNVTVNWVKVSEETLKKLPTSKKYPISIYYRLLLPEIIPETYRRIIYLDADLVIEGDVARLWDMDDGGRYTLAVPNLCQRTMAMVRHVDHERLGIDPHCKYYNAGVLVINLDRWRTGNVARKSIRYVEENSDTVIFPDQDALNVVLAGKWGDLNPRWNQMHALHTYSSWQDSPYEEPLFLQVLNEPFIVHFTTPPKPWQSGCQHPQRELFYRYLDMTPWRGWRNTILRRGCRRLLGIVRSLRIEAARGKAGHPTI